MLISVVIPTLNEGSSIKGLLDQLENQSGIKLEVIVVDGGSTDETKTQLIDSDVKLIESETGRGSQMNKGARAALGEYLLFLHADSKLTCDYQIAYAVSQVASESGKVAGHFKLSFDTADLALKKHLRYFEEKSSLNRPGTWNGDQGLLIPARTFWEAGGFWEELPFLEDQDFAKRFHKIGQFITCDSLLITSARRFELEGLAERATVNAIIMAMFHLRLNDFFAQADEIYRSDHRPKSLDPLTFLELAKRLIFKGEVTLIFQRLYQLGQYATKNMWQLALARGIRKGTIDHHLKVYDRRLKSLIDHPVGYLMLMTITVVWMHIARWRLASQRSQTHSS